MLGATHGVIGEKERDFLREPRIPFIIEAMQGVDDKHNCCVKEWGSPLGASLSAVCVQYFAAGARKPRCHGGSVRTSSVHDSTEGGGGGPGGML